MSGEQDTPSDTGTFHPADISVRVGDIVEWDYSPTGLPPHNIVFADGESLSNRLGLGVKPDGTSGAGTWQVRFILPGTYLYRCTFHPGMNGMVTVGG